MQAPQLSRPSSKRKTGYIVALAGSALSVFSFLALPFISISIPGLSTSSYSFSLLQIIQSAQLAQQYIQGYAGSYLTTSGSDANVSSINAEISLGITILWILLIVTIAACVIALVFTIRAQSRALGGAISLIVLGVIGAGAFLAIIIEIAGAINSASKGLVNGYSFIGIGAWICVLGMLATFIGGIIAVRGRPQVDGFNGPGYGYGGVPQQPQYPTNMYQQYPQQPPSYPNYPPQSQQYPLQQPPFQGYPQQPQNYPSQQPPQ